RDGLNAMYDFSEGILDLMLPSPEVVDYLGKPEMLFFGPDEGTAGFMDAVAYRGRERGYRYWRTLTTGKSFGIPHDVYGLTRDGRVFGLLSRDEAGTELQIDGETVIVTPDCHRLYQEIGDAIDTSGMTTMGVMASFRTVLDFLGMREEEIRLMMTGGPDGDLGGNQIQSFRGKICLLIDGGSVLYDPDGLNRTELVKLALARHTSPRLDSMAYPAECIGPRGFRVPRTPGPVRLPDGTEVPDGAYFHRRFLVDPAVRRLVADAHIQAFLPCGGFKDTINGENVGVFLQNFPELRVIVEGANVFFSDAARDWIARESNILQIKDSTANKGGVTCSAIAEVLSMFLLGDRYERVLVHDARLRSRFIGSIFQLIAHNAVAETRVLLNLRRKTGVPLHTLSVTTSEALLSLQDRLYRHLEAIAADKEVVDAVIRAYVPAVLLEHLGLKRVLSLLNRPELRAYRDAILTKKIAAMALYRYAEEWEALTRRVEEDCLGTVREIVAGQA
ncbi:MAG: NADP-specific glutamate dehydrogenase GdhA, partial [Armatimonadota bacterium]|nr:NADP-specific glutamate dehydrogenase GdhA [Armatimonadota bacterium]